MIYVIFSIVNCTVQVLFQAHAFTINKQAADFLTGLIDSGNASLPGFFVLGSQLSYCDHVPKSLNTKSCMVIWNGTSPGTGIRSTRSNTTSRTATTLSVQATSTPLPATYVVEKRAVGSSPEFQPIVSDGQISVRLQGLPSIGNVTLDNNCLLALNWPVQT
jgi:hypothetical protein